MERENPELPELQRFLDAMITEALESGSLSQSDVYRVTEEVVNRVVPQAAAKLVSELKRRAPAMLREHRTYTNGFVRRNQTRWKKGFDVLEMMIVISQEIGELINIAGQSDTQLSKDPKFTALTTLHARAVIVAREILCLLTGGFADGALGRWRTLHEVSVVAVFLAGQSSKVSERYLLRRNVEAYKAAVQYRRYEKEANLEPFSDEHFAAIEKRKANILLTYGQEMYEDWGWAAPVLGNKRPTFAAIEEFCHLDHWRPRYKWSSQDTHGNHRPHMTTLAMSEAEQPALLMGASNSGMVDPAQMMARSLVMITNALVQLEPKLELLISDCALRMIEDEVGKTFMNLSQKSLNKHRKQQSKS